MSVGKENTFSDIPALAGNLGPWRPMPYETMDGIAGTLVYAQGSGPSYPELRIPLPVSGRYRIFLGVAGGAPSDQIYHYGIKARLERDPAFVNIFAWALGFYWEISENYWKTAELDHDVLLITNEPNVQGVLAWIRLEPVPESEKEPRGETCFVATNDGYAPHSSLQSLKDWIMPYADGPVKKLLFCLGYADICGLMPTQCGTVLDTGDDVPNSYILSIRKALAELRRTHADPIKEIIAFCHGIGLEFHASFRNGSWYFPGQGFKSDFFHLHPEWHCKLFDGTPVTRMSLAAPEVRNHWIQLFREALSYDVDGLNLIFTRALPTMLFEEPFQREFVREYGQRPQRSDEPEVFRLRRKIMTAFMRDLRNLLDTIGQNHNRRLELSLMVPANGSINMEHGLDLACWASEGLIDMIQVDGTLLQRNHEERQSNIDLDYFASVCRNTKCRFFPRIMDANCGDEFLAYYRKVIAHQAAGVTLWDGTNWRSWNYIRQLTDRNGDRAEKWYRLHRPETQVHLLKTLDGFDVDKYTPHNAF